MLVSQACSNASARGALNEALLQQVGAGSRAQISSTRDYGAARARNALLASPLVDSRLVSLALAPRWWTGLRWPLSMLLGLATLAVAVA